MSTNPPKFEPENDAKICLKNLGIGKQFPQVTISHSLESLPATSVADPDPVGSGPFRRIRMRIWIRSNFPDPVPDTVPDTLDQK